jgi:hypothetical protein
MGEEGLAMFSQRQHELDDLVERVDPAFRRLRETIGKVLFV